mmetsp:Transcript_1494/g.2828  ORF Transcript_1494/g.2828 Transcript_1494/m.2828 type:complete len:211 (+) Transcript_1494:196-828(+)
MHVPVRNRQLSRAQLDTYMQGAACLRWPSAAAHMYYDRLRLHVASFVLSSLAAEHLVDVFTILDRNLSSREGEVQIGLEVLSDGGDADDVVTNLLQAGVLVEALGEALFVGMGHRSHQHIRIRQGRTDDELGVLVGLDDLLKLRKGFLYELRQVPGTLLLRLLILAILEQVKQAEGVAHNPSDRVVYSLGYHVAHCTLCVILAIQAAPSS